MKEEIYILYSGENFPIGFCDTIEEAKEQINLLVKEEIKRLREDEKKKIKIYTEDIERGKKIYRQELGHYINGVVEEYKTFFYLLLKRL
jgi:hypothetical protein